MLGAPFDWVVSIEVGEHIPAEYTKIYIGTIYTSNSDHSNKGTKFSIH